MTALAPRPVRRTVLCSFALLTLAAVGCGPGTSDVSGKVMHRDKPVSAGTVTLVDAGGMMHQGEIGPDGQFSIPKVQNGPVKIAVTVPKPNPNKPAPFGGKSPELPTTVTVNLPDLPYTLASPDTSGLTGTIAPGKSLVIDLPK